MGEQFTVVVADDEPDVRLLLRLQLGAFDGVSVVGEAGDGAEVLEVCRETQPDAVVMDLLMPRMMGQVEKGATQIPRFEAVEALQQEMPEVGIVAYTATAGDFVRQEMDRLGVPLLLKSGDIRPLVEALRSSLRSAR